VCFFCQHLSITNIKFFALSYLFARHGFSHQAQSVLDLVHEPPLVSTGLPLATLYLVSAICAQMQIGLLCEEIAALEPLDYEAFQSWRRLHSGLVIRTMQTISRSEFERAVVRMNAIETETRFDLSETLLVYDECDEAGRRRDGRCVVRKVVAGIER
jgi:hypothetical protein